MRESKISPLGDIDKEVTKNKKLGKKRIDIASKIDGTFSESKEPIGNTISYSANSSLNNPSNAFNENLQETIAHQVKSGPCFRRDDLIQERLSPNRLNDASLIRRAIKCKIRVANYTRRFPDRISEAQRNFLISEIERRENETPNPINQD